MFVKSLRKTTNVMRTIAAQKQLTMNARYFGAAASAESASVKNVTSVDADAPINFQPGKMSELEQE